ncbi:MAG TPA: UvrB/UvrC motif-containing protein, partial [Planctomycetaceae bacterium]|nr:UvrB/UvrC motif-containing protein [Planctomycetaceae bacterium]
ILYADHITDSMQRAIEETERRRVLQTEYNREHGITPETIKKAIRRGIEEEISANQVARNAAGIGDETKYITQEYISELEREMLSAAEALEFERAAALRDRIQKLQSQIGESVTIKEGSASEPGFARGGKSGGRKRGRGGQRTPRPRRK